MEHSCQPYHRQGQQHTWLPKEEHQVQESRDQEMRVQDPRPPTDEVSPPLRGAVTISCQSLDFGVQALFKTQDQ